MDDETHIALFGYSEHGGVDDAQSSDATVDATWPADTAPTDGPVDYRAVASLIPPRGALAATIATGDPPSNATLPGSSVAPALTYAPNFLDLELEDEEEESIPQTMDGVSDCADAFSPCRRNPAPTPAFEHVDGVPQSMPTQDAWVHGPFTALDSHSTLGPAPLASRHSAFGPAPFASGPSVLYNVNAPLRPTFIPTPTTHQKPYFSVPQPPTPMPTRYRPVVGPAQLASTSNVGYGVVSSVYQQYMPPMHTPPNAEYTGFNYPSAPPHYNAQYPVMNAYLGAPALPMASSTSHAQGSFSSACPSLKNGRSGQMYGAYMSEVSRPRPDRLPENQRGSWSAARHGKAMLPTGQPISSDIGETAQGRFAALNHQSFVNSPEHFADQSPLHPADATESQSLSRPQIPFFRAPLWNSPNAPIVKEPPAHLAAATPSPPQVENIAPEASSGRANGKKRRRPEEQPGGATAGTPANSNTPATLPHDVAVGGTEGKLSVSKGKISRRKRYNTKNGPDPDLRDTLKLSDAVWEALVKSAREVDVNSYSCKLPILPEKSHLSHCAMEGTEAMVHEHLNRYHGYSTAGEMRKQGPSGDGSLRIVCPWNRVGSEDPKGPPCTQEVTKKRLASHIVNVHLRPTWLLCPKDCGKKCRTHEVLARHLLEDCRAWMNSHGVQTTDEPSGRPTKKRKVEKEEKQDVVDAEVKFNLTTWPRSAETNNE